MGTSDLTTSVYERLDAVAGLKADALDRWIDEQSRNVVFVRAEVLELRIEIDEARQAKRVSEITDTDFFRDLRSRAATLRQEVRGGRGPDEEASDGD